MLSPSQFHYKIIHTTCHTQWGGLEKRIFNEAAWMRNNGHDIIIAAPRDTPLFRQSRQNGFRTYGIDFKKSQIMSDYRFLRRLFANEQPDIVNTHGNEDSRIALLAAYRTQIGCRILSRHISAHVRTSWYNRLIYKKYATYIFTPSDYTTGHLKEVFNLNDRQVFSMPSGIIPPPALMPRNQARHQMIRELGLDPDTRFIGFVGRVSRANGVETLLKAFNLIARDVPGLHLVFTGDSRPEYFQSLEQMAQAMGLPERIHFTGPRKDVWPCYRALDCKVASIDKDNSPFEGFPRTLLEAMYCECPVIGAISGDIPDIIEHDRTGLLFDHNDATALSQQILRTLENPEATEQRVRTARETVEKHHTIDAMGRKILKIYQLHHLGHGNAFPDD
ncbi:MAG: glycosyltransferase family 4 protein [Desulfotignum sp.]|nr:glycosyltransferase family 4 protein [Desulfotignum sp.]